MEMQIIQGDTLAALTGLEIDKQIATAKAFPRDLKRVLASAKEMATMNLEIAESCSYAKPGKVKDPVTGDLVDGFHTGPSVRLAEILVSTYGNIRAAVRVVANDGIKITAQASFHDLETNAALQWHVDRSILTSKGKTFSNDMQVVTGNAACAIAFRNCAFKVIPAAYVYDIYKAVLEKIKPPVDELPVKREAAINYFTEMGVTLQQILDAVHAKGIEDIGVERLMILRGFVTSINTGEYTKEELFPEVKKKKGAGGNEAENEALKALKGQK